MEPFEVMEIYYILVVVVVALFTFIKTHWNVPKKGWILFYGNSINHTKKASKKLGLGFPIKVKNIYAREIKDQTCLLHIQFAVIWLRTSEFRNYKAKYFNIRTCLLAAQMEYCAYRGFCVLHKSYYNSCNKGKILQSKNIGKCWFKQY